MNMNFNQLAMFQQLKTGMDRFRENHPKFPMFLQAVSQDALKEGSVIEINVTTPEGKNYCSNIKINTDDLSLIETLKNMKS
ncbi:MAG: hypothetical protein ACI4S2_17205 [Lachnospiraceae bacterium]